MANDRQTESVEKRISRNSNKNYTQVVLTAPARIFKEKYLTKKGKRLMKVAKTDKEKKLIKQLYEKNRYQDNPDCFAFRNPNGKIRRIKHT